MTRLYEETVRAVLGETKKLSFGECGWDADDAAILAEVLPMCVRCQTLNLGHNICGDAGTAALCASLVNGAMPKLNVLALNHNQVGDVGVQAIAAAAQSGAMGFLRSLFLMHNVVGDAGCRALARALSAGAFPKIVQLSMQGNPCTGIHQKMCRYWAVGTCTKGDACQFRHGPVPPKPDGWRELESACRDEARSPPIKCDRE